MAPSSTRTERAPAGRRLALAAALCLAAGCGDDDPPAAARPAGTGPVVVSLSVDWEGAFLDGAALAALAAFRQDNPGAPVTHFVCPAYYTKPGADPAEVTAVLAAQVRPGDEVGVHLHAWNSLVAAAGVPVKPARSFLTADGRLMEFSDDAGFDADPAIYTTAELRSVVATSRRLLEKAGFQVAPVFRAGGWLATPAVLEAARAEGFTVDASATDARWLAEGAGSEELRHLAPRVRQVWPAVDAATQPFAIATPAGPVQEVPDSGAMADHLTAEEMEQHVLQAARAPRRPVFVHLGLHAETADTFAPALSLALASLRRQGVPLELVTVSRAAELARRAAD